MARGAANPDRAGVCRWASAPRWPGPRTPRAARCRSAINPSSDNPVLPFNSKDARVWVMLPVPSGGAASPGRSRPCHRRPGTRRASWAACTPPTRWARCRRAGDELGLAARWAGQITKKGSRRGSAFGLLMLGGQPEASRSGAVRGAIAAVAGCCARRATAGIMVEYGR